MKTDFILDIIEGIVCLFGIIVFSIACVEVVEMQRFLFAIADIYCAIKLTNCVESIFGYIKNKKKNNYEAKELIIS